MNTILFDAASKAGIDIRFNHKLLSVDMDRKLLTFDSPSGTKVIDASRSRVLACDGVNSIVRASMEGLRFNT